MAILGVIADDFTGATDIAGMLVKNGMRTIQTIGVPPKGAIPDDVDAVVVALKTRSIAAKEAIAQSLAALDAPAGGGLCALLLQILLDLRFDRRRQHRPGRRRAARRARRQQAIYNPAFPENGRTSSSPSVRRRHPAVRLPHAPSSAQSDDGFQSGARPGAPDQHKVGLVPLKQVQAGSAALRAALDKLAADGVRHVVVDAVADTDLGIIGEAVATTSWSPAARRGARPARRLSPSRTAGAQGQCRHAAQDRRRLGRARGLVLGGDAGPDRGLQGPAPSSRHRRHLPRRAGRRGSTCLGQGQDRQRADPAVGQREPESVKALQAKYGVEKSSQAIEKTKARLAKAWSQPASAAWSWQRRDVGRRVGALDVTALRIGPEIDPGVPWTASSAPSRCCWR